MKPLCNLYARPLCLFSFFLLQVPRPKKLVRLFGSFACNVCRFLFLFCVLALCFCFVRLLCVFILCVCFVLLLSCAFALRFINLCCTVCLAACSVRLLTIMFAALCVLLSVFASCLCFASLLLCLCFVSLLCVFALCFYTLFY